MTEVSGPQASKILSVSIYTIHRKVDTGLLPARKQGTGKRKFLFIDIDELREFAAQYGYRFDEAKAAKYTK